MISLNKPSPKLSQTFRAWLKPSTKESHWRVWRTNISEESQGHFLNYQSMTGLELRQCCANAWIYTRECRKWTSWGFLRSETALLKKKREEIVKLPRKTYPSKQTRPLPVPMIVYVGYMWIWKGGGGGHQCSYLALTKFTKQTDIPEFAWSRFASASSFFSLL